MLRQARSLSPSKGMGVAFDKPFDFAQDQLRQRPYPEPSTKLLSIYQALLAAYGPQHWWPTANPFDPFEVMVGAILTQAAAWANVEKAIANLRGAGALSPSGLRALSEQELARLVYPSGYYNAKARKLHALAQHLAAYGDNLEALFAKPVAELRKELLSIHGVGEETADSIILYAAGQPSFVVDAYTRRLFVRLGITHQRDADAIPEQARSLSSSKGLAAFDWLRQRPHSAASYHGWQALFEEHLPPEVALYNQYHALIVVHSKGVCRKQPRCPECCLMAQCAWGKAALGLS